MKEPENGSIKLFAALMIIGATAIGGALEMVSRSLADSSVNTHESQNDTSTIQIEIQVIFQPGYRDEYRYSSEDGQFHETACKGVARVVISANGEEAMIGEDDACNDLDNPEETQPIQIVLDRDRLVYHERISSGNRPGDVDSISFELELLKGDLNRYIEGKPVVMRFKKPSFEYLIEPATREMKRLLEDQGITFGNCKSFHRGQSTIFVVKENSLIEEVSGQELSIGIVCEASLAS